MLNLWIAEVERLRAENARLAKAFDSALKMRNEEHAENEKLTRENKALLEVCKLMAAVKDSDDLSGMLRANRAAKAVIARSEK